MRRPLDACAGALPLLSQGVRGKHYKAYQAGTNVVFLEPDRGGLPDSASVNQALRLLVRLSKTKADCRQSAYQGAAADEPRSTESQTEAAIARGSLSASLVRSNRSWRCTDCSPLGIVIEMFARHLREDHGHRISPPRAARAPA
jgi:hypothetical protein